MRTVRLGELTVREVREFLREGNRTIILPYGVVEQHGYHMPLDTDIRNATFIGEALASGIDGLVAPTLNYCFSGGMLPGTINVRPNTFSNMICEIIESLAAQGFENFVVLTGHGGSESVVHLKESLRMLKWVNPLLRDRLILFAQPWDFSPTWSDAFKQRDYHAGMIETSLLMHWTPEIVREPVVMDTPEIAERLREDPDSYQVFSRLCDLPEEIPTTRQDDRIEVGVMGYPEKASAELGATVFREVVENGVAALGKAIREAAGRRAERRGS